MLYRSHLMHNAVWDEFDFDTNGSQIWYTSKVDLTHWNFHFLSFVSKSNVKFCLKNFLYLQFPIITGHGTEKVLLMKFEVLGLVIQLLQNKRGKKQMALIWHSWNTIDLKIIGLFFCLFDLQLSFLFNRNGISFCDDEIIWFLVFRLIFWWVLHSYFLLFSLMSAQIVQ